MTEHHRRNSLRPPELLERVKHGHRLSDIETQDVVAALSDAGRGFDRYTLLHVLGRADQTQLREVVERYLCCPEDPQLSQLSLTILCTWWNLTEDYLGRVLEFVGSVHWDVDQEVRQTAIGILGRYIRSHRNLDLLARLLSVVEDQSEWTLIREDAVRALAVALGHDLASMPPVSRREPLDSPWSHSIVAEALGGIAGGSERNER
jgi:hypothetical protein